MTRRDALKLGAVCVAIGIALIAGRVYQVEMAQRFSSERWKAERGHTLDSAARYDMAEDLMRRLPKGMARNEVADLLGTPDRETKDRIAYKLGAHDLSLDYYTLEIKFDDAQQLTDTALVQG
ncbi:hypothetical protein EJ066_28610 [Mesorhizobium sp. M9A.F.Ca.ET.002.03.1.2]|uniref:hypothetical protein n=1 Tax=Mesorhizobium sp. M9A.F.Ca.ET.002.03.1.2 TaxID=2493668 RepID=UPI000F754ED3|nr:hypothetical protein [Mesorhizobium sp. M9A.F.Ca.ET.002.03.1.2]AZO00744.1 hypothetical protein EJ066_28610 [Mesorhizobium sp. M9A.F.Ca.ET.002.03.1.2]